MDELREISLAAYDRLIGLELSDLAVDGCITKAAKIAAYTYGFHVNRLLGRPQDRIKELWA